MAAGPLVLLGRERRGNQKKSSGRDEFGYTTSENTNSIRSEYTRGLSRTSPKTAFSAKFNPSSPLVWARPT